MIKSNVIFLRSNYKQEKILSYLQNYIDINAVLKGKESKQKMKKNENEKTLSVNEAKT